MRITPKKFDFYYSQGFDVIADRVVYELNDGSWIKYHVCA